MVIYIARCPHPGKYLFLSKWTGIFSTYSEEHRQKLPLNKVILGMHKKLFKFQTPSILLLGNTLKQLHFNSTIMFLLIFWLSWRKSFVRLGILRENFRFVSRFTFLGISKVKKTLVAILYLRSWSWREKRSWDLEMSRTKKREKNGTWWHHELIR